MIASVTALRKKYTHTVVSMYVHDWSHTVVYIQRNTHTHPLQAYTHTYTYCITHCHTENRIMSDPHLSCSHTFFKRAGGWVCVCILCSILCTTLACRLDFIGFTACLFFHNSQVSYSTQGAKFGDIMFCAIILNCRYYFSVKCTIICKSCIMLYQ